jgi:hypothetical protein
VKLFSFIEFCLWNAQDDGTNFQRNFSTGEVEVVGSTLYHKTEYRERRNHYAFYHVNAKVAGFDTDRETFLGLYNGFSEPDVVARGKSGNSVASGWSPSDSQLALSSKFVPMVYSLIDFSGSPRSVSSQYIIGDPVTVPDGARVRKPDGSEARAGRGDRFAETDTPGDYRRISRADHGRDVPCRTAIQWRFHRVRHHRPAQHPDR